MTINNKLLHKYKRFILKKGKSYYIKYDFLTEFINGIINDGYAVLGYDGMYIDNDKTIGFVDVIFDFSKSDLTIWEDYKHYVNMQALKNLDLLRTKLNDRIIENKSLKSKYLFIFVVCIDKDQWI